MKLKRILVPHDGGQMSDKALLYAEELAKALNSEVTILYVIEEIEVPATLLLGNDRIMIAKARRSIARELEQKWNNFVQGKVRLLSSENVKATSEVRVGDPGEQILKFAKDNKVDLIVMGSRRLEGMSKVVVALGSVARKVSERAPCPVMIIHSSHTHPTWGMQED
ncbi:universal stress protein [Nitrososphaera sp.]|uniref:universal stress protein n=1 Tax=Nitrososphaera sp. TaxID=1971748 RepID=UPI00179267DF|nr:universal stress protein [Nitrososphaera sp.]NWG38204.1 universal stress protein [Nitrososphaera sp.]